MRRAWAALGYALYALGWLALFALALLAAQVPYLSFDLTLTQDLQAYQSQALTVAMRAFSFLGNRPVPILSALAAAAAFLMLRWRGPAILMLASLGGFGLEFGLKLVVHRPRPMAPLVHVDRLAQDSSFPSGHALFFLYFYGLLGVLLLQRLPNTGERNGLVAVCLAVVVLGGLSRIYLGEHWPSDVAGGFLLGALWLATLLWVTRRLGRSRGAVVTGFR